MKLSQPAILRLGLLAALASTAHAATPAAMGDWKTPDGSIVRVEPCGPAVCLRLVQVAASAPASTDAHNPEPALRGRRLCGLTLGTGFHPEDATHLTGGMLYDPKSGHTYHGTITLNGDLLKLRGYIGISLFGRSETWARSSGTAACR